MQDNKNRESKKNKKSLLMLNLHIVIYIHWIVSEDKYFCV